MARRTLENAYETLEPRTAVLREKGIRWSGGLFDVKTG